MHIATDTNGVIKKVIAATAKTHDSTQFNDEEKAIFADSGYMSKERKKDLRKICIHYLHREYCHLHSLCFLIGWVFRGAITLSHLIQI